MRISPMTAATGGAVASPPAVSPGHRRLGLWASRVAAASAASFGAGGLLDRIPSVPNPWGPVAAYLPSLVLALVLPLALVAVHHAVPPGTQVWTHAALVMATIYSTLAALTYVTQLLVVEPHRSSGRLEDVGLLDFTDRSFLMVVDTTAYTLLGVALLLLAPVAGSGVLGGPRTERLLRRCAVANGLLAPVYLAAVWVPPLIVVGALWLVAVPAELLLVARMFRPGGQSSG
jgi:hypothetical protein